MRCGFGCDNTSCACFPKTSHTIKITNILMHLAQNLLWLLVISFLIVLKGCRSIEISISGIFSGINLFSWFTWFVWQSPWKWDWPAKHSSFDNLISGNDPEDYHWPLTRPRARIPCRSLDSSLINVSLLTGFFKSITQPLNMMTSSNGNIFCVTGHLCGEFTGHRWIPHTKASDPELSCFLWSASE